MHFLTTLVFAAFVPRALGATCKYIQAKPGDGCYSLAQRCGITETQLERYNTKPNFCHTIQVADYICCSAGSLPDFSPKPNADGTCYTYSVKSGDTCSAIAQAKKMDETKIPGYNKNTWGWEGCTLLQIGQNICLSSGTPPFPSPVPNSVCGPQVPGTKKPAHMPSSSWANLNPCPLNACCDKWGQCGITNDFCTKSPSDTGAPGTSRKGTNGCISNCGTDIVNNRVGPSSRKRIGYFESFNMQRPCLNMDVSKLQGNPYYTHIHWAFANVTNSWMPDVSGAPIQFNGFLKLTGVKKILSFGGWGFSTDAYTFNVFRNGVKDGNRQIFAKNVVDFIVQNNLDGVDFDWEYPGAQDIPGIPPDSLDSGANYLAFLQLVRSQLPASKTLSIAAPASFWYLKGFPIKAIAGVVDYIVYMTYDLHGQWDYGNKFSDPGCPKGGCLRSQVNKTETEFALAMITKAGVQANQLTVGLPLYGRSFKMTSPSCTGVMCTFTGPASGAAPGPCTNTPGYISNYEIYGILNAAANPDLYGNTVIQQFVDEGDVLIYDGDNYVSWLSPSSYDSRRSWYDSLNFGGTSDWAVDLNQTYSNNGTGDLIEPGLDEDYELCDLTKTFGSLDALNAAAGGLRSDCIAVYTLQVLIDMLDNGYANYTNVNNGYDALFGYYVTYIENLVPEILSGDFLFNTTTTEEYGPIPEVGYGMNYFNCQLGNNGGTIPCKSIGNDFINAATYPTNMILTDHDGYLAGLATAGLSPDWVDFGDFEIDKEVSAPHGGRNYKYKFTNAPVKNNSMVVPNPKDIVTKGIGSIPALRTEMQATLLDIALGQWLGGAADDAAQAYSTPVFTLLQAIDAMAQAKQLGAQEQQAEEDKLKNFILLIVSAVLFFVPVVGEELAAAAGFATLARALALVGELGNGALAVYDTVNDPSSAIVNILGMLFGVGSIAKVLRDGTGIGKVAKIRTGMTADEISTLGTIFTNDNGKLQSIMKVCKL